jgi:Arc/MetJ-type ribon-helix-helix transcriptional regulator
MVPAKRLEKKKERRNRFSTISLPTPLVESVEKVVGELKYWPTKTDFVREAVLEKLERYKKEH